MAFVADASVGAASLDRRLTEAAAAVGVESLAQVAFHVRIGIASNGASTGAGQ